MHENSLACYRKMEQENKFEPKEQAIMDCFGPLTKLSRQQLVPITHFPINTITGRVKKLLKQGNLIEDGDRFDATTKKRQALLRLPVGQLALFQ